MRRPANCRVVFKLFLLRCTHKRMRRFLLSVILLIAPACASNAQMAEAEMPADAACKAVSHQEIDYIVCRFHPERSDIRLFLNNAEDEPFSHFNWVGEALAERGERLAFAMNAGMYHEDRSPVGFYLEEGVELAPLNTNDGPGNFHLKPNGIFLIDEHGAWVTTTASYQVSNRAAPFYATQSGPMLVIDGEIHPRFLPDSDSLKRRNGVGVTEDGEVIFALADTPVRFYGFATFFRDELATPNALYLDGTISRLYAPELSRNDPGVSMGPIVGVVVKE
jgi:uncharacterized protein YigE (DUF2233 family)